MQMQGHLFRLLQAGGSEVNESDLVFIGADIPLDSRRYPVRELLHAFRDVRQIRKDLLLILAGKRVPQDDFLVWNYLDEYGLIESVIFLPYYDVCRDFPVKKEDCALWIPREICMAQLTSQFILDNLESTSMKKSVKLALFITSFSPAKFEGNSALMRQWLKQLRASGYRIHLLQYNLEQTRETYQLRQATRQLADMVFEIDLETRLVGSNKNGLNVHVDDWCGSELLKVVDQHVNQFEYDVAIVNYCFLSAAFTKVADYTRKILVTHDDFADRNRRMIAQGFPESGWMSLDRRGEVLAFRRSDVVVALQDGEAELFRSLAASVGIDSDIRVVAHVPESSPIKTAPPHPAGKIRIGYLGSSNWVNEQNLAAFLNEWALNPILVDGSEIVIAGGICTSLVNFITDELMTIVSPRMLGEVPMLSSFFEECDVFINPERGGTGIKIKTLDAMAHDCAVITTAAGSVGIESRSRFHDAKDVVELANLVAECVFDHGLIDEVRSETRHTFSTFSRHHHSTLTDLLGPTEVSFTNTIDLHGPLHPKISVIIPFFNVQDYIEECIASVLCQTFVDYEIILVDDQSPDGSRQIAERLAEQDARIRIITHPTNAGLGPARNTGVRHACGTYIFFLDSDDLLASRDVFSTLISTANSTGCQVVIGSCERLQADGTLTDEDRERDREANGKPGTVSRGLDAFLCSLGLPGRAYLPVRAWGSLILLDYYIQLGLDFPPGEHEDMPHIPFLYYHANGVFYSPQIAIFYRERIISLSKSNWTTEKLQRYAQIWTLMKSAMVERGLHQHIGDAASAFACHLMWRVGDHGIESSAGDAAVSTLALLSQDLSGATNRQLLFSLLRGFVLQPWDGLKNQQRHAEYISQMPQWALMEFHQDRLGIVA
jgi:hypothetical protein